MDRLIQRSERIEQAAWEDLYRGAPPALRAALGIDIERCRSGMRLSAGNADHLLLNRAIGLRCDPSVANDEVADVLEYFRRRRIGRYWVQLGSDQRHGPLPSRLARRGVLRYPRSWMKFVRTLPPVGAESRDVRLRPAEENDLDAVARLLAAGFDLPPTGGALLASGLPRSAWRYLVADDERGLAAAAAMFVLGEDAYLAFAATDSRARGRGLQGALMKARFDVATSLGCRRVFTETGLPVRGEPNSSYRNMLRLGFDELYVRDNFAPEGSQWSTLPSSDVSSKSSA